MENEMAKQTNGVFGFEYLEDAELEQNDVVGCTAVLGGLSLGGVSAGPVLQAPKLDPRIICDIQPRDFPQFGF